MNQSQFRARFPEFSSATATLVQAFLDAAALETNADEYGAAFDEAHGLLAAHKMAISPFGKNARMTITKEDGTITSTYEAERLAVTRRSVVSLTAS